MSAYNSDFEAAKKKDLEQDPATLMYNAHDPAIFGAIAKPTEIDFTSPNFGKPPPPPPQPQYPLPASDYPRQTTSTVMDPAARPNYIPPTRKMKQMYDHDSEYDRYLESKRNKMRYDHWIETMQVPFFMCILFFLFHLPAFISLLEMNLGFASITKEGVLQVHGLALRSLLFGGCIYGVQYFTLLFA